MDQHGGERLSRRGFVAAGTGAAAALLVGCGSEASTTSETSRFGEGDVGILNYFLELDYMQLSLYSQLEGQGFLEDPLRKTVRLLKQQEAKHVQVLRRALHGLGGKPLEAPKAEFALNDLRSALVVASKVETAAAAGYLAQIPKLESEVALEVVGRIVGVEGRHTATVNSFAGLPTTPEGPMASPAPVPKVLAAIGVLTVGGGDRS